MHQLKTGNLFLKAWLNKAFKNKFPVLFNSERLKTHSRINRLRVYTRPLAAFLE